MANRTIDELPVLDPSIDERLKDREITADNVWMPARVNSRTIKINMDGPLFVPQIPDLPEGHDDDASDNTELYRGAILALTADGGRGWRPTLAVWRSGDTTNYPTPSNSIYTLNFNASGNNSGWTDLRSFSDICTVTSKAGISYIDQWRPISPLIGTLVDTHGNDAGISAEIRCGDLGQDPDDNDFSGDNRFTKVKYHGDGTLVAILVR